LRAGHLPRHVAIIMDGNGRWATRRGRPRTFGHAAGARAVRRTVEEARRLGIEALTLYAFSSDNWQRPESEVAALMHLFRRYLASETARCVEHGIRLRVIGRRDRLGDDLRRAIEVAEVATAACSAMVLRVAVDYGARDAIVRAAARLAGVTEPTREEFSAALHDGEPVPDVDLMVRTGGERRLSDFLLWECAYAELAFIATLWPDFAAADLHAVLADFMARERRYGGLGSEERVATGG
jgi:undecaprenyl diphosphate synthase